MGHAGPVPTATVAGPHQAHPPPPVAIRLLGRPSIEVDGRPGPRPRGHKGWAVLAYLLLTDRPQGRRRLAALLFPEADDPLGALRWTLADLRRALGPGVRLSGDPVSLDLDPQVSVDVWPTSGPAADEALLAGDGDLLEGIDLTADPVFESWLVVERHRLSAAREALARRAALRLLAAGSASRAAAFAARAVQQNPLEEGNHVLLVRALAAAGDHEAARRHVVACTAMLARELGIEPSPALAAASSATATGQQRAAGGRAAAATQLEAGRAAVAAGAIDAGVDCLRRAVHEAELIGDRSLAGQARLALGTALVHAVRGADDEGAIVLHEAIRTATEEGDRETASAANLELGFVEVQAGRRRTAERWLDEAEATADTDSARSAVAGMRGMNLSDTADYPGALEHLRRSIELARRAADHRQEAWSLSIEARVHLLRGDGDDAADALERSLALVEEQRWLAFLPWPQALRGELALASGDLDGAAGDLERSWALATQLGDPCWEGMAARGLALLDARRGDRTGAGSWTDEARSRCTRVPDRYQWVHGHVLDATVGIAIDAGDVERATRTNAVLAALAARGEMAELVVRSRLHAARLGDTGALSVARRLADDIDNPALRALAAGGGPDPAPG